MSNVAKAIVATVEEHIRTFHSSEEHGNTRVAQLQGLIETAIADATNSADRHLALLRAECAAGRLWCNGDGSREVREIYAKTWAAARRAVDDAGAMGDGK